MDWLFERTIELAAWVALILCAVFFAEAVWMLVQYAQDIHGEASASYLAKSGLAATKFVGMALAMGILACIDHYVFDVPDEQS